jgi:hypothetical protein
MRLEEPDRATVKLENSLIVFAAVLITHTFDEASIAIAFGQLDPIPPPGNFSVTVKSSTRHPAQAQIAASTSATHTMPRHSSPYPSAY